MKSESDKGMIIKRKIDSYLEEWLHDDNRMPLIVKGARQIGKTYSIEKFGKSHYKSVLSINFVLQPQYRSIFDDGYEVDTILKNITIINPSVKLIPGKTLLFFDELQSQPAAATSLKSFHQDGRYDVICSGSLMGINYQEIESNSVGYKEDYEMYSLDFEEFLWAKGYTEQQIEDLYQKMHTLQPLTTTEMETMGRHYRDYLVVGGMPAVVKRYVTNNHLGGILEMQRQLLIDYEEDITKYVVGLDKGRVKNVYNHISIFLGQENKKFQISKIGRNSRSREYVGTIEWLEEAGIIHVCHCLNQPSLPLKGNYVATMYKLYYHDNGMLIASLDEEAQEDLRQNRNFNTYKGAIYENAVAEALSKQRYGLYYYRNEKSTIEMDFFIRDAESLIPIEVKAGKNASKSLVRLIESDDYPDIRYGIKLSNQNIGYDGRFYTLPYFMAFMLKRFVRERRKNDTMR